MRHRQVEAFRSVMLAGSVTEAAKMLHISQPSVSRLVGDLERAVGFALFERRQGRIFPTAEAVEFYEEVERSFLGLDRLMRYAQNVADLRNAHLTISGMPALSMELIPNIVGELVLRYPSARITIEARSSERIVDWVAGQHCDVGFAAPPYDVRGVVSCLEMSMPCVAVMPKTHRLCRFDAVPVKELRGEKVITLSSPIVKSYLRQALGSSDIDHVDTTLSLVAHRLVEQGLGVGIMEPLTVRALDRSSLVMRPLTPRIPFDFAMLAAERRASSKTVREIRDIAIDHVKRLADAYGIDISLKLPQESR